MAGGDFKRGSAEVISDLLSKRQVKRGIEYLRGEEFRNETERVRKEAERRLSGLRKRYGRKRRTPETAAKEKELTLRLAQVGTEAAELRLRLSELLDEEERLRKELEDL